ncbi:MAG: hypothetical protein U0263_33725 [Polyangiaceae bacterium]
MTDPDTRAELGRLEAARSRDRVVGLMIIIAAFVAGLAMSLWAKGKTRPELPEPPAPPTLGGIVGYPNAVDILSSLPGARAVTKRTLLRNIWAEGVKSDGTLDLNDITGRARYTFQSLEGEGPQPAREPGTLPRRHYCGKQTVHLKKEGLVADPDVTDYPCPSQTLDPLPEPPRCGFAEVWAHAIKSGAPRERMARIEYYRAKAGPAWRFEIPGTPHKFALYGDCGRQLDEAEAFTVAP